MKAEVTAPTVGLREVRLEGDSEVPGCTAAVPHTGRSQTAGFREFGLYLNGQ